MDPTEPALSPPRPVPGLRDLPDLLRRNADFRRLFFASVVSLAGDWFAFVAVSGLVIDVTGRQGLAAVVFAASVLPIFLIAPVAGVVADRVDRKRMMIAADVARVVPALLLIVAHRQGSAWLAIACVAAIAALAAFFEPVVSAVTPNLVEPADLPLAQSTMGAVWGTMLFVGAGLGGLVAATLGREAAFAVNALSFALSAALVWRIRGAFRSGPLPAALGVLAHLGEVLRFVGPRKVTKALLTTKAGVGVANGIVGLLPAYAISRFGSGDAGFGLLLGVRGLGALVGPFVGRALIIRREERCTTIDGRRLIAVCGWSIVTYGLAYALLPLTRSLGAAAVLVFLAHLGGGAQWVLSTYGLQATTPDTIRGRVMAADFGFATLAVGLSSLAAGGAAEVFGLRATSWGLAAMAVVYGAAWLAWTAGLRRGGDPLTPA